MVKASQFSLLSGNSGANCVDKNILRSAVDRNDRSAAFSGGKKRSFAERKLKWRIISEAGKLE